MQPVLQRYSPWAGPALLLLGAAAVAALAALPDAGQGKLDWWLQSSALTPERILPLVGMGVGLMLAGPRLWIAALVVFAAGIGAGFVAKDQILATLGMIPNAPIRLYYVGPIGCIAAGLALVPGAGLRPWLLPVAAFVVGAALALTISLTDPSFDDATIRWTGVLIGVWITAGIGLTGQAFRRPWVTIAGRILGSWLIAIGALYGGASLVPPPDPPPEPAAVPQTAAPAPSRGPAYSGPSYPGLADPRLGPPPDNPLPGLPDQRGGMP
ncbi:MAG: hypothetical protein H6842_11300 [Rhodospirillaceae bacterium]|nr:hypothetical protein [Rhodospirillaceae bacterium]